MATTIYINGTDRTSDIPMDTVKCHLELTNKPSTLSFAMRNPNPKPSDGDVIEFYEDSEFILAGIITVERNVSPLPEIQVSVSVTDWRDSLMGELVRKTFKNRTLTQIVHEIIKDKVHETDLKLMLLFDDGTGTTAADFTNYENDATLNGSMSWDTSNYAVEFPGDASSYVSVADTADLDFSTTMSVCVEFRMDNLDETLLAKENPTTPHLTPYRIDVDENGDVVFSVSDGSTLFQTTTTDQPISTGTTHTVVCTFDNATGYGKIYVDGALKIATVLTTNSLGDTSGALLLGAATTSGSENIAALYDVLAIQGVTHPAATVSPEPNFDGKMYRVSAYSRVLAAKEARQWHSDILETKAPERYIAGGDTVIVCASFPFVYPADAFTRLATELGLAWYITPERIVKFLEMTGGTPVDTITESGGDVIKDSVSVETSRTSIKNVIYVRGGTYPSTWRTDIQKTDGTKSEYPLPYKYSDFEMFSDSITLANDIRSWFKMEESSGSLTDEFSSNTLAASNLTYSQTGQLGDAVEFNGTSSVARDASGAHVTGDASHSLTAWINPDVHDTTKRIVIGIGDFSGGHSKLSLIQSGGTYYLRHENGDTTTDTDVGDLSGGWHLVGMSYNADTSVLRLYVNGEQKNEVEDIAAFGIDAGVVEIGGDNGSNVFDGKVDESTVFDYALSDQEHQAIYLLNSSESISAVLLRTGNEFLDTTGFDGYYNFNEKHYTFESAPTADITLYATGQPYVPILVVKSSSESIQKYGRREMSITDGSLKDLTSARQLGSAELARRKEKTRKVEFETFNTGIRPGVTLTLQLPSYEIDSGNFFVQKVDVMPYFPVASGTKKHKYKVTCVTVLQKDWVDFLRDSFERGALQIDPNEAEESTDIVEHTETVELSDTHSIPTNTAQAESVDVSESHTLTSVTSGGYKWSNSAGTTPDKLRWGLGDWG